MSQVSACRQSQAHDGIAWFAESQIDAEVSRRPRVRLYIGMVDLEKRLCSIDCHGFNYVYVRLSLVVAFIRIAFRVFVGEHGTGGFQHRFRYIVLRGDEPEGVSLSFFFRAKETEKFGVLAGESRFHRRKDVLMRGTCRPEMGRCAILAPLWAIPPH